MLKLAVVHSTLRVEEKLIRRAAEERGLEVSLIDVRKQIFSPDAERPDFDVVLERSLSTIKGYYTASFYESWGIPVVNPLRVALLCGDKWLTSLHLREKGVPVPRFAMAFDLEQALKAIERLGGYPVVLKPPLGSWGRLMAKLNDNAALEAVIEHKQMLGSPPHQAFYLQEFVRKPGRDIRAFVIDGKTICAIYRESEHWITNTARGAVVSNCPVTAQLNGICRSASEAVGGGVLAIDLFESEKGLLINEVNHTMEFKNSEAPTGISISGAVVEYCRDMALS